MRRSCTFGGKRAVAAEVWTRFGVVQNFIEPFLGSGAVLLARPARQVAGNETVNDKDESEHEMPRSWAKHEWKAQGGYGMLATVKERTGNEKRERIWFSPACLSARQGSLFDRMPRPEEPEEDDAPLESPARVEATP